jgi:hypothetical protein
MLISAWINGEPTSWYAPRFGLPETESVELLIRWIRKLRSIEMSHRLQSVPNTRVVGGYARSTADLGESPI